MPGPPMASFRICSNCFGVQVYPYMGFMTGQRYQCQECEEIFSMPIEFETTEDYLEFLKVQSPTKFAELQATIGQQPQAPLAQAPDPEENEGLDAQPNGKPAHQCIVDGCTKGKQHGAEVCRKHWREGHDVQF